MVVAALCFHVDGLAKVNESNIREVVPLRKDHILWLQIAVHKVSFVETLHHIDERVDNAPRQTLTQSPSVRKVLMNDR